MAGRDAEARAVVVALGDLLGVDLVELAAQGQLVRQPGDIEGLAEIAGDAVQLFLDLVVAAEVAARILVGVARQAEEQEVRHGGAAVGGAHAVLVVMAAQLLPVDDGVGAVDQALVVFGLEGVVDGQALALVVFLGAVFANQIGAALAGAAVDVVLPLEQLGGEADLVAAVEALLQFDQQALLFGIGWVGFGTTGAVAVGIAAAFQLMALALAGLQQPRGVLVAAGQGAVEAPAVVGAVVVALDQAAEVLALGQQVFRVEGEQLHGAAQGAGADQAGVGAAHDIHCGQAVEVDRIQAALGTAGRALAACAVGQPRHADSVDSGQHAVAVQAADVDAFAGAAVVHAGLCALAEVVEAADLALVQGLGVGAGGGGQLFLHGIAGDQGGVERGAAGAGLCERQRRAEQQQRQPGAQGKGWGGHDMTPASGSWWPVDLAGSTLLDCFLQMQTILTSIGK